MNSKQVRFKSAGPKTKVTVLDSSDIRAVQTSNDTYFFSSEQRRFVSLKSLLDSKAPQISDEEIAEAWLQLREGKLPPNFQFLAGDKPIDVDKMFVRHGRTKGEYLLKDEVRLTYESLWSKGQPHGQAVVRYPNNNKKYDIVYVYGKMHGAVREYYETGQLRAETHYLHGTAHGTKKVLYANGNPQTEGAFVEGTLEGCWKDYYDTGTLLAEYHLVHGKRHGTEKKVHANGKPKSQGNYVTGMPVGWHRQWAEDGSKAGEMFYDDNGVPADWYCSVDGKKHGPISSAEVQSLANSGKLEGIATRRHANGKKREEGVFKAGKKAGAWTSWWPNEIKREEGMFDAGKKIGVWSEWFLDGKKRTTQTYLDGVLHGGEVKYSRYTEGLVIYTCQWVRGQKHGKEVSYNQFTGKVSEEGEWVNGLKHGLWSQYGSTGSLDRRTLYVNDVPQG
jgi:antitoxin component YwqK of YwqJK toxin-antitoxin module